MADCLVHKAVELSKVKKSNLLAVQEGITSGRYYGQPKYDGVNGTFILPHGHEDVISRTGETYTSMLNMIPALRSMFGDLVLLTEIWKPDTDFAVISGEARRGVPSDSLIVVVFDALTLEEWEAGRSNVPYKERMKRFYMPRGEHHRVKICPIHFSVQTTGASDWQDWANKLVASGGYDGAILRDSAGIWVQGSGTTGEIIKVKNKLSLDLRVTGIEEGKGRNAGRTGNIIVDYKGRSLGVGTGLSDADRIAWWADPGFIIGRIVEVEAMGYSKDGLLREPRLKGIRYDKQDPDV